MNGLNSVFDSHFLQEVAPRNLSEIKFRANPKSLLDIIYWLVGIQECLECHNILLPSYTKPLMWWWSYEWPHLITWEPNRMPRKLSEIKFLLNPRSMLDAIEWLVGIWECLECCNILLPTYNKPLMCCWTYEWPQLNIWQPILQEGAPGNQSEIKFQANPRSLL